jgi:predicted DNA-binding transcriptional regulator AlpA
MRVAERDRWVREPELLERLGVCSVTLRNWERKGLWPPRVKIGPRAVAWSLAAVVAREEAMIAEASARLDAAKLKATRPANAWIANAQAKAERAA